MTSPITVVDIPRQYGLTCPNYTAVGLNMTCHVNVTQGSNMSLMVDYGDNETRTYTLPSKAYKSLMLENITPISF